METLPPDEIIAFDRLFTAFHTRAYRWDVWGAAYVINGGCSDDGFCYFRAWLIGQGDAVYENVLKNPDTLARVDALVADETGCEDLLYGAGDAYKAETGEEMPSGERLSSQPI